MKISEVTTNTVKRYLRITSADEETTVEENTIEIILPASIQYIKSYTGLDNEKMDTFEDLTVALLVLCSDMYDNRQMQVNTDKQNPVVSAILALHCVNYL